MRSILLWGLLLSVLLVLILGVSFVAWFVYGALFDRADYRLKDRDIIDRIIATDPGSELRYLNPQEIMGGEFEYACALTPYASFGIEDKNIKAEVERYLREISHLEDDSYGIVVVKDMAGRMRANIFKRMGQAEFSDWKAFASAEAEKGNLVRKLCAHGDKAFLGLKKQEGVLHIHFGEKE